jgi:hypothetical protein
VLRSRPSRVTTTGLLPGKQADHQERPKVEVADDQLARQAGSVTNPAGVHSYERPI